MVSFQLLPEKVADLHGVRTQSPDINQCGSPMKSEVVSAVIGQHGHEASFQVNIEPSL